MEDSLKTDLLSRLLNTLFLIYELVKHLSWRFFVKIFKLLAVAIFAKKDYSEMFERILNMSLKVPSNDNILHISVSNDNILHISVSNDNILHISVSYPEVS